MAKTITAHTLVKNEDRYLWFSVMSVIDFVDQVMIWDTGSSDNTLKIIKELHKANPRKIKFTQFGEVNPQSFTTARQEMLKATTADWMMILDGDEVWWKESIKEAVEIIQKDGNTLESLVHSYYNLVGDIFHYQDTSNGGYEIDDKKGFVTIRFINMTIPGLSIDKPHGQQGYYDTEGNLIQNRSWDKRLHLNGKYMHFTNVQRSSLRENDLKVPKRDKKLKFETGKPFPLDFYYPEVFFEPCPGFLHSPWTSQSADFKIRSHILTPIKKIKRKLINTNSGY